VDGVDMELCRMNGCGHRSPLSAFAALVIDVNVKRLCVGGYT
jgi:hypothetical protein